MIPVVLSCFFFVCSNGYTINCLLNGETCQKETRVRRNSQPSRSSVFLYGKVYTVDVSIDWHTDPQQALVVEDETIAYVGSNEQAKGYILDGLSIVYDLNNATVLPGIHDIHMHPQESMSEVGGACQLPNEKRPDDQTFTDELSVCPMYRIGTEWVLGAGHSITQMMEYVSEGNSPKELLDSFIPDRPAAMLEETSHSAWVNSKALELANITSDTEERPGGVIMREPNSNEPNGILFENEAIDIFELAMDPAGNSIIQDFNYNASVDALLELSKFGITSFCDARTFWNISQDLVWDDVCHDGYLTARAILGLWAYPNMDDNYQFEKLKEKYSEGNSDCDLRKTQIKVYMDGIVQSTTASMLEAYGINLQLPVISVENVGMNYFDKARLQKYLVELQDFGNGKGFDFHIHAIGDKGIRDALDAIEAAKSSITSREPRHRLTHVEILNDTDIPRFRLLDVIADFQVAGEFTLPSEHTKLAEFVGDEKAEFSIPVKSVLDSGATTTFSSDWDVSDLNPFIGLQHATQRGDQSVSVKSAIEMYTVHPAFVMRQEENVGFLKAGMDADFIIIDQDILNVPNNTISNTQVLETIFKGERIYPEESVLETLNITSSGSYIAFGFKHIAFVVGSFLCFRVI